MRSKRTQISYCAVGVILTALQVAHAANEADPKKSAVDLNSMPGAPKRAQDAAIAFSTSSNRQYEASSVDACIDEGITKAYAQLADEKQKRILSGKAKEAATYVGSSIASRSLGGAAGQTVTIASAAWDAKDTIDGISAAQIQVDECLGENIAEGKIPADIFANRREIATSEIGINTAKVTARSLPLLGGLIGGDKKKNDAPKLDNDPTRITLERFAEIVKRLE